MKKSLIAIASILAIVAGCAKNDPQAKVSDGTIKASIENTQSRATLSYGGETDNFLVWEEEDSFLLSDGTSGIKCDLVSGEGTKFGSFTPASEPAPVETYYAVYPYNNSSVGTDGVFSVVIPDEVSYNPATGVAEMGEDGSANVMVAKSSSTEIAFKNVCSYVCLTVTGTSDQKVSSINILPKDGETTVAGTAQITFDEEEPVLAFDGTVTSNTESVVFAEPVSLENGLDLKVAVAPVYTDGIQVIVTLENGEYQILTSNTTIGRNEIVKMPEFTFAATEVAQIGDVKYTSLAAAVEAANVATEDVTIKLIDNVIVTETVAIKNADHKVTLDMNSKVISADAKAMDIKSDVDIIDSSAEKEGAIVSATSYAFYAITDGITMNISDVAFEGAAQYGAARIAGDASVFNISGNASFLNTKEGKTSEFAGLHIGLTSKDNTPTVNISGGTFNSASTYGVRNRYGKCNVTGGVFTGETAAFVNANGGNNVVSITGGYFSNTDGDDLILEEGSALTGAISGGYFTKEISATFVIGGYVCAETTEPVDGPDGKTYKYTITEGVPNIASVTIGGETNNYSSIDDVISAVNDSPSDVTVKLLNDFALGKTFNIANKNAAVTLDLKGKTISLNGGIADCISIGEGVNFTLEDSEGGGTIDQTTSGTEDDGYSSAIVSSGTFAMNGGTVTVSGGSASAAYNYTVNVKSGTMNMNGGTVKGKRTGIRIEQGIVTIKGNSSVIAATTASSTTNTNGVGVWLQGSGAKLYVKADDEGNEPTIESNHNSAIIVGNATAYAEVNAGMIKNTSKDGDANNGGLRMNGGETVINGGTFISTSSHALYLNSPKANLTINGGAFVAMADGKYPLYSYDTSEKKIGHTTVITKKASEPWFVGGGNSDKSDGRALYNGNSTSKIYVSAGYFTKTNLGLSTSPNTYVAEGYKRVEDLSEKRTIAGVEYTFTMQVVPED